MTSLADSLRPRKSLLTINSNVSTMYIHRKTLTKGVCDA